MSEEERGSTSVSVKQEVGQVVKLGLVFGMIAAFGIGFAILYALSPCSMEKTFATAGTTPSVCRSKPNPISPMIVSSVTSMAATNPLTGTQQIDFISNNVVLASMFADQNMVNSIETSGALKLELYDPIEPATSFSEQVITIETNAGTKAICMPKTTITLVGAVPKKSYYIGSDGSAYHDATLTQRATTESCAIILARSFSPNVINDVASSVELPDPSTNFQFTKKILQEAGMGALYQSDFSTSPIGPDESKGPLIITPNEIPLGSTLGARVLTLMTDIGTQGVCLPDIEVSSESDFVMPIFYVGKDGTTYYDALLTEMASSESCGTILARAFSPSVINDATVSVELPGVDAGLEFYKNMVGSSVGMGALYNSDFSTSPNEPDVSKGPIVIVPRPSASNSYPTFEASILTLTTDAGTQEICLPQIVISSEPDSSIPRYYVGSDGTTYNDALLTDEARNASECVPVPAHCSNGLLDGDETGLDCGGADCTTCSISCAATQCRNASGQCVNSSDANCGALGAACIVCLPTQQCVNGSCVSR